jgi:predicted Zn-dependent protease with MMP-like domain
MLPHSQFETLVDEALASLPVYFQEKMDNVAVLVATWPTRDDLRWADVPSGHTLLGLYSGIPLTRRTSGYNLVAPDTITLFQGPIEAAAGGDLTRIREQVRRTFIHELAHHFGISDDRLRELGAY